MSPAPRQTLPARAETAAVTAAQPAAGLNPGPAPEPDRPALALSPLPFDGPPDDEAAVALVEGLVAVQSLSYAERDASEYFVRAASAMGLETEIDNAGSALAWRGDPWDPANAGRSLVLLGHIDTVPGDIPVRVERGVLHGRGSVDAKGPLAAMLVALARAPLAAGDHVLVCGATGEESAESPGANHLVRTLPTPGACVIGEPSGWDGVTLGYKGRLVCRMTVRRFMAHTAGPDASACDVAVAWWNAVRGIVDGLNEGRDGAFETVQAGLRKLESASDGLADRVNLDAGFRLPPWLGPVELERLIREPLPEGGLLACRGHEVAHRTERSDPVVRALSAAVRAEGGRPRPKVKTGTADLNVVGPAWDCPIAAYGPGDSRLDHTPLEHLVLEEYLAAARVLTRAVETITGELRGARPGEGA